ncbi:conserved hypothetical protein [Talaromyces stipitatus ATCC 10500]|uniref:Uncharacterized protein n=1 Tax=Talaromyces stipitatus (strain ATCC 10500 / CBS 375.48 / QM 6759 / NRRL 1006) TaxID=441959 RepID=B8LWW1_TALSN|nr:uncharacterized protein TSTA_079490 [Talaromyces stipitatus ATCC 10500]EED24594.1 conserved hypothetical protein [Talaromyces stipitatus ATCC 10500]
MPPRISVTNDIRAVSNLFTLAFRDSPPTVFVLRDRDSTWPVSSIPLDILGPKMVEWTTYKQSMGGELVESDNFAAAAIWFPPGAELPASSEDDEKIRQFRAMAARAKKEFLNGKKYWYLNMIARHPERKEPGVIRALFEPYIARAREEGATIWLEAVSEHSKQVYEHFGFRTVATMRMGEGKASPDGELQDGGEGILVYAMILE